MEYCVDYSTFRNIPTGVSCGTQAAFSSSVSIPFFQIITEGKWIGSWGSLKLVSNLFLGNIFCKHASHSYVDSFMHARIHFFFAVISSFGWKNSCIRLSYWYNSLLSFYLWFLIGQCAYPWTVLLETKCNLGHHFLKKYCKLKYSDVSCLVKIYISKKCLYVALDNPANITELSAPATHESLSTEASSITKSPPSSELHETELELLDLYSGCGGMSTGLCFGAKTSSVNLVAVLYYKWNPYLYWYYSYPSIAFDINYNKLILLPVACLLRDGLLIVTGLQVKAWD